MITSTANSKVKHVRRLQQDRRYREREQAYVVEGTRWVQEAASVFAGEATVFYTPEWAGEPQHEALLASFEQRSQKVSEEVMASMSDVQTPQGILAVLPMRPKPLPEAPSFLLVLDGLQTPGNLGTILRTAAAAGADGVLLAPGSVDAYNPKVIRGAMGAHLRLPIHHVDWDEIQQLTRNTTVWLATAAGDISYTDANWRRPSTLIIGGEAHGGSARAQELAQRTVHIPMHANTESLNAAMAAGIILFEAMRQRRL
ncbi:MAG: TrmH family RNA methyltransferase [Chloroflexota bacterium]